MLFLLSPAKKLDYDTPLRATRYTLPIFVEQAAGLIKVLKTKSAAEVAELMSLSAALSELNVARYAQWAPVFTQQNARQAVSAFNGDVYEGLEAGSLSDAQLDWAQDHVAILSGLYGVLRPRDLMQPYRLEMGTRLSTSRGRNLYEYWGSKIADYLNALQQGESAPVIVNLASEEYFKSVDKTVLRARVVQCVFQDWTRDTWKVVSFHAKRARGLMARYAIESEATTPKALQAFASEGYAYDASVSCDDKLVFRRKQV
jgi:uncharacterized protein